VVVSPEGHQGALFHCFRSSVTLQVEMCESLNTFAWLLSTE